MIAVPTPVTGAETQCPDITGNVKSEQLASLLGRTITPSIAGLIFSVIPVILFWAYLPHAVLLCWLVARTILVVLRVTDSLRFKRMKSLRLSTDRLETWRKRYFLLLGMDALSWGLMAYLFYMPGAAELNAIILAAVVAVMAISLFTLGNAFSTNLTFSTLSLAPMVVHQFSLGTQLGAVTALGLIGFLGLALNESRKMDQRVTALLRNRFANAWVAEQRQLALQSAEHSSTSKSRFVAVMSHEIRTPLNGILGMTQLLERSSLDTQQREHVNIMRRSGQHLLALVNDILDLARIESGKLAVDTGPVNLHETVEDVCQLLSQTAHEKGLNFELKLSPALPQFALGDASRIKQVLHNLIGNAIKFTEQGFVRVDIGTIRDMRAGSLLRFAVQDSGEGIAADQLERVFAPFEQAQDQRHKAPRRQDGTGLGLTISRELARAMGGDLRCSSAPGHGSLFEFTLPLLPCETGATEKPGDSPSQNLPTIEAHLVKQDAAPVIANNAPSPITDTRQSSKRAARVMPQLSGRVLLVDDSAVNVLVASSMLQQCGLRVDQAENGQEALDRLQDQAYDLVLMDCQMPVMDGFEATRRWRSHERAQFSPRIPIVALTASAVNGDRERCIQCGMDDYLVKPFEMDDLLGVAQRHLQVATPA
ncbi:response regulator [Roseateles koreensis]|uniref:histidine kinase n=1 Tax=Roseateles koreensis TaxID=2987526 RepID=A0ABT5KVX5_9BURK|nr:response regulator [Roseateles koreensis]MDC8787095.1 response regulator [Roseateles koreensis]